MKKAIVTVKRPEYYLMGLYEGKEVVVIEEKWGTIHEALLGPDFPEEVKKEATVLIVGGEGVSSLFPMTVNEKIENIAVISENDLKFLDEIADDYQIKTLIDKDSPVFDSSRMIFNVMTSITRELMLIRLFSDLSKDEDNICECFKDVFEMIFYYNEEEEMLDKSAKRISDLIMSSSDNVRQILLLAINSSK